MYLVKYYNDFIFCKNNYWLAIIIAYINLYNCFSKINLFIKLKNNR